MVKLADTPDLGSGAVRREGSSPSPSTTYIVYSKLLKENKTSSKSLSCQEFPRNSGIKIRKVANRKGGVILGHFFLVIIPSVYSEHGRVRKQLKSKEAAKLFASLTFEGIRKIGVSFTSVAKENLARVLTMLNGGYKKSLEDVCNEMAERKTKLNEIRDTYFI